MKTLLIVSPVGRLAVDPCVLESVFGLRGRVERNVLVTSFADGVQP